MIGAELSPRTPAELSPEQRAAGYLDARWSPATKRAYRIAWADWSAWAEARQLAPMPADPAQVALWIADRAARLRPSTLAQRLAAVATAHRIAGEPDPTGPAGEVLSGVRRVHGSAQAQAPALRVGDLRALVDACPDTVAGLRDRALLLVGWAGAMRRSELAALELGDVERAGEDGIVLRLRRSKTDQEGHGQAIPIAHGRRQSSCPVRALDAWIAAGPIAEGPLFRRVDRWGNVGPSLTDRAVGLILQAAVKRADLVGSWSAHSLRAGLATEAAAAGVPLDAIQRQTRHRDLRTLLRYIREGDLFRDNPGGLLL